MPDELVPLGAQEDSFALAVIEYGGNLAAAYRSVFGKDKQGLRKAQELISRPEIALRIKAIADATQEHALISLGSHLQQLAVIRDKSIKMGDMRTGLAAEVQRGTVAGYYKEKSDPKGGQAFVQINIGAPTPANPAEWAKQYGSEPVIIENPA